MGGEDLATGHVSRGLRHTHGTQRWLFGGESVLELNVSFFFFVLSFPAFLDFPTSLLLHLQRIKSVSGFSPST